MAARMFCLGFICSALFASSAVIGWAQERADRDYLARTLYEKTIECYRNCKEDEALTHVGKLSQLYPAEARRFPQAVQLREDMRQRKANGTLGKPSPEELPKGFASPDQNKQIAFLSSETYPAA